MLDTLFSPLAIGSIKVRNRLAVSAMVTSYCAEDGTATEQYIAYHEAKAKGGWGLITTEDYAVAPSGKAFRYLAGLWDDSQIASHSALPERVHRHGAKILAQIYHSGRQAQAAVLGHAPLAPSAVPDSRSREVPRALAVDEIATLVQNFGDTARRAKQAGFDGVEIHGGHGYLIAQFLSPYSNKRTDRYGGSLTNRMRFALEVIDSVRKKAGSDFVVGMRISSDELMPGGRTIEDTLTIVPYLERAGLDYIHVSAGVGGNHGIIPPSYVRHAWLADYAGMVKRAVSIPVMVVGRINDPQIAEQVLASGRADMIAMGRASLIDPDMPNKARDGRLDEIRRCIACNEGCQGNLSQNKPITCVLNPTLGRENEAAIPASPTPKKVAVIGAGPAGLEAARTAALAGHYVTVYEKSDQVGGQFRLAAVPPCKGEIASFINWQTTQLEKLGVPILLNQEADSQLLQRERPDRTIVATGACPHLPPIPGSDLPHVVTAHDLLDGRVLAGATAVVIGGGQVGAETANYLALIKRKVTLVEMLPEIALGQEANNRTFLLKSLDEAKVRILTNTRVTGITVDGVMVEAEGSSPELLKAETVVIAVGSKCTNLLAAELRQAGLPDVRLVGDAEKVGLVMDAVASGYWAGREP